MHDWRDDPRGMPFSPDPGLIPQSNSGEVPIRVSTSTLLAFACKKFAIASRCRSGICDMPNERNFGRETQAWRISSSIGALDKSRYRSSPLTKQGAKETTVFSSSWERGQPNVASPYKFSCEIPTLTATDKSRRQRGLLHEDEPKALLNKLIHMPMIPQRRRKCRKIQISLQGG